MWVCVLPHLWPNIIMSDDAVVFTSRWQARWRAATFVSCTMLLVTCLSKDWDEAYGEQNVFSGIRPALRAYFNQTFGGAGGATTRTSAAAAAVSTSAGNVAQRVQEPGSRI